MQQRQYRPGDVLDDYCPRERRITDHAIVAMVDSEIQRTRCVSCEAEHEFKNGRAPAARKKPGVAGLVSQVLESLDVPTPRVAAATRDGAAGVVAPPTPPGRAVPSEAALDADGPGDEPSPPPEAADDRPFRRSLIRAQLPRPEGQPPPTRAIPEFTMHQPLNNRPRPGRFHRRPAGASDQAGPMRFGREAGAGHRTGNSAGQGGRRRRRKKS